jgi:ribosomal protein S18 acetylase RimI-like enzyme
MDIRNLRQEDIPSALSLINAEGWNYTAVELERMLKLDPDGSFICESDGPQGISMSVSYGKTGVIGHLVVAKKGRGKRLGQTLLTRSLDYLDSEGTDSIVLYATEAGARLYARNGFAKRRETFCVNARLPRLRVTPNALQPVPLEERDLAEVSELDKSLFGDDRSKLIGMLIKESPEHGFKIVRDGSIVGFIMARDSPVGYDMGPWVCISDRPEDATNLFAASESTFTRGTLFIPGFVGNRGAYALASSLDSVITWKTDMMVRGRDRYDTDLSKVFGLSAFELG